MKKKKILSVLLVLAMVFAMLPQFAMPAYAIPAVTTLNLEDPTGTLPPGVSYSDINHLFTIGTDAKDSNITVTGAVYTDTIEVANGVTGLTLVLDDASITNPTNGCSPIELQGSASVTIELADGTTNTMDASGATDAAGIYIRNGANLIITGTGALIAKGATNGAGIGSGSVNACGTITISGGDVTATGGDGGAGIGSGNPAGTITISGGTVNATGSSGLCSSAGIIISGGDVTATGSNVTVTGGDGSAGAGIIGGASGTITISGGTVNATGPSGICGSAGIIISGGDITATGGDGGAGIGGVFGIVGAITISGGDVTATGGDGGAGIGGVFGPVGTITISGGTVNATGSSGIGVNCGTIISGGTTTANGNMKAMSSAPDLSGYAAEHIVVASKSQDGSSPETYDAANNGTYKYFKIISDVFTVTFDKNEGDSDANPASITVESGNNVGTLPTAPTRSGYVFDGWNTAQDGSGDAFTATTAVTADITVYAQWTQRALTVGTGGEYAKMADALADAKDGDTVTLLSDITESVMYTAEAGKTVTVDGGGHKITADGTLKVPVFLDGTGTIILKDITLQGDTGGMNSAGLYISPGSNVSVQSEGTVNTIGGDDVSGSFGVYHEGSGTINVTTATGGDSSNYSYGAYNTGSGTINAATAIGGAAYQYSNGAVNLSTGTINVTTATAGDSTEESNGVYNDSTGTINVTTATGGNATNISYGANNNSTGTINVATAASDTTTPVNTGIHNNNVDGKINTGADIAALILKKGTGASCVLDAITVAAAGDTTVGTLPSVYKNGEEGAWFKDLAKTTAFSGTTVTGAMTLYSTYYEEYTVTFDKNSGSTEASPSIITVESGNNIVTLPTTAPTRSGYTFNGWNTKEDGSGTAFTAATAVTADITVYAQWEAIELEVGSQIGTITAGTAGSATFLATTENIVDGTAVTVNWCDASGNAAAAPTGLSAAGTNIAMDSSTITVTAAGTAAAGTYYFKAASGGVSSDVVTVTVQAPTFTVTFNKNGGDTDADPTMRATTAGGTVTLPTTAPTRSGYTFNGWNTKEDGSGTAFTTATAVTADITVYAQWTAKPSSHDSDHSSNTHTTTTPAAPTAPTTTTTTTGTTGNTIPTVTSTATATATIGANGSAAAAVTVSQVTDAVNKAAAAAAQAGAGTAAQVEIKVTAPADAKAVETSLPKAAVDAVASSNIAALTVSTPIAVITFDNKALNTIAEQAAADVRISAAKADTTALREEAKQLIGDRPVYNFSVTSGGNTISQFGGNVTVSVPYTPKAGENTNAIVIYYINAEGKPEIVSNCAYDPVTKTIKFTTNHFSKYAVGYNKVSFKDVPADAAYSKAVSFIAARGITTGTGDGKFSPEAAITRGQFIVMVMKAYGIKPDGTAKDNFADAGNTYYTNYLSTAKRLGLTNGTGNNLYEPDKEITKQEMISLTYKTLKVMGELPTGTSGKDIAAYSDANQVASWAKDAITLFAKAGIITGSDNKLAPTEKASRAEMAQVLYNLLSK